MGRAGRHRVATGAIAGLLASCQLIVPTDVAQCKTDGDCDARGGPFAKTVCVDALCLPPGDRCLGHLGTIVEDRSIMLRQRVRFVDIADNGVNGVDALVCASRDENCDSPLAKVTTSGGGYAIVQIPKNFRGTVQVKDPPPGKDFMKIKAYFFPAIAMDDNLALPVPPSAAVHLITRALLTAQVGARTALDPNAGHILGSTVDCSGAPQPGVSVSLTSDVKGKPPLQFYFTETRSASVTASETSVEGAFGFANVPEGPVVLESSIVSLGRKTARIEFWVNKDTITTFQVGPTVLAP